MVQQYLANTYRDWSQAYERGEARGRDQKLRGLASLYQTSPQQEQTSILSQMAGVDPEFAAQQEDRMASREDRRREQLAGMARGWKNVPSEQRQAYYERFIAPAVSSMGFGDLGPYDENAVDGVATQILAAYGGGATGGAVQSTFVDAQGNRVAIMRDGSTSVLGQNAPSNQIIDTGNGFFGVNKGNLSASPVMVGGQPQNAPQPGVGPGTYRTPQGLIRVGDLTPEQQELMLADIQAGQGSDQYQLPRRDVSPQQFGSGQQLRSAPKTADAPSGFRYGSDGQTLEPIPGGPSDPSAQGASLKDELAFRKDVDDVLKQDRSILAMYQNVESASRTPSAAGDLSMIFAFMKMLDPGSVVREQEFANAQNAAGVPDQIRNLYNRAASGQRLNENQRRDFLSQARALANQAQTRLTNATRSRQSIAEQSGLDPTRATGMADFRNVQSGVRRGPSQGGYQVGQVINVAGKRYRVTGGDPNDPDVEEVL